MLPMLPNFRTSIFNPSKRTTLSNYSSTQIIHKKGSGFWMNQGRRSFQWIHLSQEHLLGSSTVLTASLLPSEEKYPSNLTRDLSIRIQPLLSQETLYRGSDDYHKSLF